MLCSEKAEAERANHAKTEYLTHLAHEIRSPLSVIVGFADLALSEPEHNQQYLQTIQRNAKTVLSLVENLLDIAKIENGQLNIERMIFRLSEVLSDVLEVKKVLANQKGLEFIVELDSKLPEFVYTDPLRLKQILTNIIGNAIKYTEQGYVKVQARVNGRKLFVVVTDTGVGIAPEGVTKLFKPYCRLDKKHEGTGLGLKISRDLAHTLKGDLTLVRTKVGEGSQFCIIIDVGEPVSMPIEVAH